MRLRSMMITAVVGCGVLGAGSCSGNGAPAAPSTTSVRATGAFGATQSAACETDLQLVETQVDAYLAINGGTDVTEAEIVAQGLGREPSTLHDIGPGGTVIPAPGGGCAR